eukprot:11818950-Prorocentrum_lima.AAC.1
MLHLCEQGRLSIKGQGVDPMEPVDLSTGLEKVLAPSHHQETPVASLLHAKSKDLCAHILVEHLLWQVEGQTDVVEEGEQ